ncbi:MAG: aspartate/glutamate racemase family protein [Lysobacterales bacterium]
MKKIGIVGGVAWQSTADYYSEICRRSERLHASRNLPGAATMPEMSIESLDLRKAIAYLGVDGDEASWSRFDEYHRDALLRLEASGAEFAVIASSSPHHRFAAIVRGIGIPVINLFDVVARECARIEARQVLILGTAVTMRSGKFREAFVESGVEAASPQGEAALASTTELIAELQQDELDEAAERIDRIARHSFKPRFATQPVVCLACTELALAFPEQKNLPLFDFNGLTYMNTRAIHIGAAFDYAVSGTSMRA